MWRRNCILLVLLAAMSPASAASSAAVAPDLTDAQRRRNLELMSARLFPNRTLDHDARSLQTRPAGVTSPPASYNLNKIVCVKCSGLQSCPALNGLIIEEVYLPNNLVEAPTLGTCKVLDELGARVQAEIFGSGRTFRNTPDCVSMVMQYLCLFYGSNNVMYRNWCQFVEDVRDALPANHKVAPRYPCRSFCVQVATTCAYDPLFVDLCRSIACPPTEDSCTADPSIGGQRLAANLGCSMPYVADPYSPKNGSSGAVDFGWALVAVLLATVLLLGS